MANARAYEWLGLTATNQVSRNTNLINMFRADGQVMHLLEIPASRSMSGMNSMLIHLRIGSRILTLGTARLKLTAINIITVELSTWNAAMGSRWLHKIGRFLEQASLQWNSQLDSDTNGALMH